MLARIPRATARFISRCNSFGDSSVIKSDGFGPWNFPSSRSPIVLSAAKLFTLSIKYGRGFSRKDISSFLGSSFLP